MEVYNNEGGSQNNFTGGFWDDFANGEKQDDKEWGGRNDKKGDDFLLFDGFNQMDSQKAREEEEEDFVPIVPSQNYYCPSETSSKVPL